MLANVNVEGSGAGVGENDGVAEKTMLLPIGESSEPEKSNGCTSLFSIDVGVKVVCAGVKCSSASAEDTNATQQKAAAAIIANLNFFLMAGIMGINQFICNSFFDFFMGCFCRCFMCFCGGLVAQILLRSHVNITAYCRAGALLRVLICRAARKRCCENDCKK